MIDSYGRNQSCQTEILCGEKAIVEQTLIMLSEFSFIERITIQTQKGLMSSQKNDLC
jgi:hypothetical protein